MPYGIIDKKVTGIGATTLELKAPRNSIIVVPTKSLASSKCTSHNLSSTNKALYVGSKITGHKEATPKRISNYLQSKQQYRKLLVVADSLPKVLTAIGKENYNDYFLMIDEADALQADSLYRPALENALDNYFEFNPDNRCLVSATIKEFSHPKLKGEAYLSIGYSSNPVRNIRLIHSNCVNLKTFYEIKRIYTQTKGNIVIAYNSLRDIQAIISLFHDTMKADCQIFCSEKSKDNAGEYYTVLENGKLEKRITFITCAYFVGVDIDERYHLISVSDNKQSLNYSMLSIEQLIQISGRCRDSKGLLSDTIIFSTREYVKVDLKQFFASQEKRANWIVKMYNLLNADDYAHEPEISPLCEQLSTDIEKRGEQESLARKNIYGEFEIAWLNLDALKEQEYLKELYSDEYEYQKILERKGWKTVLKKAYFSKEHKDVIRLKEAEKKIKGERKINDAENVDGMIAILKVSGFNEDIFRTLKRNATRETEQFIASLYELHKYVDKDFLIDELKKTSDKRILNSLNNKIIFKALDDTHPFKMDIVNTFKVNQKYEPDFIDSEMYRIFNYHLKIEIEQGKGIKYLRQFFKAERTRSRDKQSKGNPYEIYHLYAPDIVAVATSSLDKKANLRKYLKLI